MSAQTPDNLFENHLPLASKIGHRFPIPGLGIDESVHEARIALWQAANTFDPTRGSFEGFASIVIRNHLRNVFERAKRTAVEITALDSLSVKENEEVCEKENIPAHEPNPLLEAERSDIRKALEKSIEGLTASQKELLERFASGESYAEIGREKGVSPAAIRQMLMRASERIRPNLEAKSIDVRFMPWHAPTEPVDIASDFLSAATSSKKRTTSYGSFGCFFLLLLALIAFEIILHAVRFIVSANN